MSTRGAVLARLVGLTTRRRLRLRLLLLLLLLLPLLFVFPVEEIPAAAVCGFRGFRSVDYGYGCNSWLHQLMILMMMMMKIVLLQMISFFGYTRQRHVTTAATADVRQEHFVHL